MLAKALSRLMLVAGLALFVGVGVLAFGISATWDSRNTDVLVSSLSMSCAVGAVAVAVLLAVILGIPLGMRLMDGRRREPEPMGWRELPPMPQQPMLPRPGQVPWADAPPMLTSGQGGGEWHSQGPAQYDLWDEAEAESGRDWRGGEL